MNGSIIPVLLGAVMFLLGVIQTLMGIAQRRMQSEIDKKASDSDRVRIDGEISSIRQRLHDLTSMIGEVKAAEYYRDKSKEHDATKPKK